MSQLSGLTYRALAAKITSGGSLSAAVALGNATIVAIIMPAAWDTASLTFQASADGTAFFNCYDTYGSELSVSAAASRHIIVPPLSMPTCKQVKVRSGTSGSAVNQTADRIVQLLVREYA